MGNYGPLGSSAHVTQIDPLAVSLWLNEMKSFFKTTDKKFYKIGCGPSHSLCHILLSVLLLFFPLIFPSCNKNE